MPTRSHHAFQLIAAAALGALAARQPLTPTEDGRALATPRRSFKAILWEIADRIGVDNLSLVAAGVAFYGFLALFPAAAAIVAVLGLVTDPHIVERQVAQLSGILPQSALDLVSTAVKAVAEKPPGQLGLTFAISVAIALWSARAGVTSLMTGLDIAYRVRAIRSFVAQTAIGFALTLGGVLVAVMLLMTIAVLPAIEAAASALFIPVPGLEWAWLRWPFLLLEMALSLAVIYRVGPSQPLRGWRIFSVGALVATVLWLLSSCAFSLYVSAFGSYDATYGSLAGAVVMMLWLWAS